MTYKREKFVDTTILIIDESLFIIFTDNKVNVFEWLSRQSVATIKKDSGYVTLELNELNMRLYRHADFNLKYSENFSKVHLETKSFVEKLTTEMQNCFV